MGSRLRRVLVDDTDPQIKYTGAWIQFDGIVESELGDRGPPFLTTKHGLEGGVGSFTFTWTGSNITVFGGQPAEPEPLTDFDPVVFCRIDGQDSVIQTAFGAGAGAWPYCESQVFQGEDAQKTHTIEVNVVSKSRIFFFDYIEYVTADAAAGDAPATWTSRHCDDEGMEYSGTWERDGQPGISTGESRRTKERGAKLTYSFAGDAVTWLSAERGFEVAREPGLLSYSIDGNTPATEVEIPLVRSRFNWEREMLFNISGLGPGLHKLEVTNLGNSTRAVPLRLSEILVRSSPGETTQQPQPSNPEQPNDPANPPTKPPNRIPAIVGGVVGGVVALGIIVAIILFFKSRKRRKRNARTTIDFSPAMESRMDGTIYHSAMQSSGMLVPLTEGVALVPVGDQVQSPTRRHGKQRSAQPEETSAESSSNKRSARRVTAAPPPEYTPY